MGLIFEMSQRGRICSAVKAYFQNLHNNVHLAVKFLPKPNTGAQGGFICQVANEDYFIKNHTFMGRSANHSRVDLRELFVYRALFLMGTGAEPHFIGSGYSNAYISKLALHIATKRVPGFQRRADRSTCSFSDDHQTQLNIIKEIFFLTDLNSGNVGLDDRKRLAIVDFVVEPSQNCIHRPNVFDKFREIPEPCKDSLRTWNLLESANTAKSSLRNDQQRLGRIIWREGYEEYLEIVMKNIHFVTNLFSQ
uniref:PI3K/PI4K domain-containing protein n=1 Tax=Panagrellus redivivus TaxID=6233 RepID=A0A7E4URS9_PANRE